MGLFGILMVLAGLGDRRVAGARAAVLTNCTIFAGLTLFQGAFTPGIDNTAHVAGLVAGMVLGLPIFAFSWGQRFEPRVEDDAVEGEPVTGTPTK
jgi:membrane associated rhomboid family serine protease